MRTLTTEHMRANEFRLALDSAGAGEKIIYAVGELGRSVELARKGAVHDLWRETLNAHYDGKVGLVQRRLGLHQFQYIAVKCHGRPRKRWFPTWIDGLAGRLGRKSEDSHYRRDREEGRQPRVAQPV